MKGNTGISPLPLPRSPVGITAVIFRAKMVARICDFFYTKFSCSHDGVEKAETCGFHYGWNLPSEQDSELRGEVKGPRIFAKPRLFN